ncbi:RNAse P Rpr2/Rpp21/SNM1 subunit domain-containing protein [Microdochium trichocladiopsis]|uniref:RNAse P Rpr2/Rpp21/SNM1 subunit domain-containing protein n=1 Tax=Microdochium trichocladiopsis TaxID=1682393 RepID=A0A9P9BXV9_9PEZI|nr:RNAse P Rpr2/Rpp21/SNM1 subunit domain-containing protein [Microdochium trichocladiopsis]KAH7037438.1 RNAse P Rpr2/Rpp21/SNM1 subunit domain-containing protein [Microdochium trichocladiopsis]
MAKAKTAANVPNRHIYTRMSFLYQAAAYLSSQPQDAKGAAQEVAATAQKQDMDTQDGRTRVALSRRLMTDMRSTSKKAQISLTPALKHTICKYCDTLLMEGQNSTTSVENLSKGGRKPWADMIVVKCHTCGGVKRFPVNAPRQKRRPRRDAASVESTGKQTKEISPDHETLSSAIATAVEST